MQAPSYTHLKFIALFLVFTFSAHTTDIYTNSCTALFRCQTNCLVYLAIFLLIKQQHIFWLVAKLKKKTRNFFCFFFLLLISMHMISISRYHNGNNVGMCNISSHTLRKFSPQLVVEWIPPSSSNWPPYHINILASLLLLQLLSKCKWGNYLVFIHI